jgi:hypothetical protein
MSGGNGTDMRGLLWLRPIALGIKCHRFLRTGSSDAHPLLKKPLGVVARGPSVCQAGA